MKVLGASNRSERRKDTTLHYERKGTNDEKAGIWTVFPIFNEYSDFSPPEHRVSIKLGENSQRNDTTCVILIDQKAYFQAVVDFRQFL